MGDVWGVCAHLSPQAGSCPDIRVMHMFAGVILPSTKVCSRARCLQACAVLT